MDEARVGKVLGATAAVAGFVAVVAAARSWSWPIVHDAALMHYVGWRLWEGDRPIVDVLDVNLPATHLFHMLWHGAFDASPVAWRVLDLGLLGVGCLAVAALLRPHGRAVAGLGAALLALWHLHEGAIGAGQRDFFVGTLELVAAAGVVAHAEGRRGAPTLLVVGALLGLAVAIKPTAVVLAALLTAIVVVATVHRHGMRNLLATTGAFALGVGAVAAVVLGWLASRDVLGPWWSFWTSYMPLYREVSALPLEHLLLRLRETPTAALLPLAPFHLAAVARARPAYVATLAAGLVGGAAHFVLQTKGYTYHLAPWSMFLIPAGLPALQRAWADFPWRTLGPLSLAEVLVAVGISSYWSLADDGIDPVQQAAAHSLAARLHPGERVLVMDLSEGGLQGLLEARVPQASRFVYDAYFFHDLDSEPVRRNRAELMAELAAAPPDRVVVFEKAWPTGTYERLATFPELRAFLRERYEREDERDGYRVYRRRGGGT
jgi:hypothetical protein